MFWAKIFRINTTELHRLIHWLLRGTFRSIWINCWTSLPRRKRLSRLVAIRKGQLVQYISKPFFQWTLVAIMHLRFSIFLHNSTHEYWTRGFNYYSIISLFVFWGFFNYEMIHSHYSLNYPDCTRGYLLLSPRSASAVVSTRDRALGFKDRHGAMLLVDLKVVGVVIWWMR